MRRNALLLRKIRIIISYLFSLDNLIRFTKWRNISKSIIDIDVVVALIF